MINPYVILGVALAFVASLGWGGFGWYQKLDVEKEFSDYQRQAAEVITQRLKENSAMEAANRAVAVAADTQYLKGKRDAERAFQPVRDDLAALRSVWGLRNRPDGLAMPGGPDSPGLGESRACTDQPSRIIEAAARVAEDLATCAEIAGQLASCREYALNVKCSAR